MDNNAEIAFLQAIRDYQITSPGDHTPRLIYADWLEEQGDSRAALIRVQVELDQKKYSKKPEDVRRAAQLRKEEDRLTFFPRTAEGWEENDITIKWGERLSELFPETEVARGFLSHNRKDRWFGEFRHNLGIPWIYMSAKDYMTHGHNLPFSAVSLHTCALTEELFADDSPLQLVTHLKLGPLEGNRDMLSRLGNLKNLLGLDLKYEDIRYEGWDSIINSKLRLQEFTLTGAELYEAHYNIYGHTYLDISNSPVFAQIEKLTLKDPYFPNVEMFGRYWERLFQDMQNLKELQFSNGGSRHYNDRQDFDYFLQWPISFAKSIRQAFL